MFGKKNHSRRSNRSTASQRRLAQRVSFETLEERQLMSVNYSEQFSKLQDKLQSFLHGVDEGMQVVVDASQAKLPIVDKSLGELTGIDTAITSFKQKVDDALAVIGQASTDNLEQYAEDTLNQYLGSGPDGIDIELGDAEVSLPQSGNDNLIDIKLHLGKVLESPTFKFGLGLPSIPFVTTQVQGAFNFDVGFKIPDLEFGVTSGGDVFVTPFDLKLEANANLIDPQFDAALGFLHVHASANPANPQGNKLQAGFGIHVDTSDLSNPSLSSPVLNGFANVDLALAGGFTGNEISMPNVQSNFVLHWDFVNSQAHDSDSTFGSGLTAEFKDVRINLGTYLTGMVMPAVEKIQQYTDPYKDFFHMLADPIPVVSDVAKVVGDNDGVSLLDIATILNNQGVIPAQYSVLVTVASEVVKITNIIDSIQTQKANEIQNAFIDLGNFDLIGNQGNPSSPDYVDIRDVPSADSKGFGKDVTKVDWSDLNSIESSIDYGYIKQQINNVVGDDLGNALGEAIDNLKDPQPPDSGASVSASYKLSFPITEHPAQAVFGLLVGQDTDLVSFTADAKILAAGTAQLFNYEGFYVSLLGGLNVDAHLKLGYDTYGLRHVVYDLFNAANGGPDVTFEKVGLDLLDGLYIDKSSHLNIGASFGIQGGANWELLKASVTGTLSAGVAVEIPDSVQADTTSHSEPVVRPSMFTDDLFHINGNISGSLDLHFELGVSPLSISKDINIANGTIAEFDTAPHPGVNPFQPTDEVVLGTMDNGVLTLNMGTLAMRNARNYRTDTYNEKFVITHSDARDGDAPGEAVNVTFGGYTQRYQGVNEIHADGADGSDTIEVDKDIHAAVNFTGGAGSDTFDYQGSGAATLDGGDDDDRLLGGSGVQTLIGGAGDDELVAGTAEAHLFGGDGDDKLLGGSAANELVGDAGNDHLVGGSGTNTITGGDGNDTLLAGPQFGDVLNGGEGNDTLEANRSLVYLNGGNGDDNFVWKQRDPAGGIGLADGAARINGGGGYDRAMFIGGSLDDTFTVGKPTNNPAYAAQVLAAGGIEGGLGGSTFLGNIQILLDQVEGIDVEGGKGADNITVNDLTQSRVSDVGVNLTDLVNAYYGVGIDGAVDNVVINATQAADNVSIQNETVIIQKPSVGHTDPITGGVTAVTGLPYYKVRTANINDNVVFNALDGADVVNVYGITGPTQIHGNGNAQPAAGDNDVINVSASTASDFVTELNVDADAGVNTLNVKQNGLIGDTFVVQQQRIESTLLHAVNFVATNGDYTGGVTLTTGQGNDTVNVRGTLPNVHTTVNTSGGLDVVNVSSAAPNGGSLAPILGTVSFDLGAGTGNLLKISDNAPSGNQNVSISPDKVLGFAGPADNTPIDYRSTGGTMGLMLEGSDSATLSERFFVNSPAAALLISARGGDDRIDVAATSRAASLDGGNGNDVFNVGYGFNALDNIQGAITVVGGDGNDQLNAFDTQSASGRTYSVGGGTLTRSGAASVSFDGSDEALNLLATNLSDEIGVTSTPHAKAVNIFAQGGNDRLTGPDAATVWMVTDTNAGAMAPKVTFTGAENLRGGTGNDRFVFSNGKGVTGSVAGGAGSDQFDYSTYTTPVTVNLQTKSATAAANGVDSVESFLGGAGSDQIVAPNSPNQWMLQGINSGQVNTMAVGVVGYNGFENLTGGTSSDVFQFQPGGRVSGQINGQGGTDTLNYQPSSLPSVFVNLLTGKATGADAGITNIENASGTAGNDILVGNAGANQLFGNGGRDILIGGAGTDVLNGGDDDDILVGGTTSYDSDATGTALRSIMTEWASGNSYDVRRRHVLGTLAGGSNGSYRLNGTTVQSDVEADTLTGGTGSDWFWALGNEITDWSIFSEKIGAN